jgi:hypothetical protein
MKEQDRGGCDDDCGPKDLTGSTPAYRRALMIVVVLNLSMGVEPATLNAIANGTFRLRHPLY